VDEHLIGQTWGRPAALYANDGPAMSVAKVSAMASTAAWIEPDVRSRLTAHPR
jgi:hypothetical protein